MSDTTDPLGTAKARPAAGRGRPTADPASGEYVEWTDEDEQRYQQHLARQAARNQTRRRQGWSFLLIVAIVLGIGLLGAAINQGVITLPGSDSTAKPCPTPTSPLMTPAQVSVRVLNGSDRKGLAATVGDELKARGYKVTGIGNAEPGDRSFPDPAQIRYGEQGTLAAQALQVQVPGVALVNDSREDASVDLILGGGYTALVPAEEAAKAFVPVPVQSPAGCVPVPQKTS